eukprot:6741747-Pyramimonas_sp.AAC.1
MANCGHVQPFMLAQAISSHMERHRAVYGVQLFKPKDHWIFHLPSQLERHRCLLSTFLMERKHRVIKRFAGGRHNTNCLLYTSPSPRDRSLS